MENEPCYWNKDKPNIKGGVKIKGFAGEYGCL